MTTPPLDRMTFVRLVDKYAHEASHAAGEAAWNTDQAKKQANEKIRELQVGKAETWRAVSRAWATAADMLKEALGPDGARSSGTRKAELLATVGAEEVLAKIIDVIDDARLVAGALLREPRVSGPAGEAVTMPGKPPTTCDFIYLGLPAPAADGGPANLAEAAAGQERRCGEMIRWSQVNGWYHVSDAHLGTSAHPATPPAGYGR